MTGTGDVTTITQIETIDKKEHLAKRLFFFIAIYILLNYFILSEIYSFLGIEKNLGFTVILVLLSFSYVLGAAALRYSDNIFAKIANVIGSVWLGIIVIASFTFLAVELLVHINIIEKNQRLIIAFTTISIITTYSIINAMFTRKKTIKINSEKIKKPIRIIQISDLHIGAAHKKNFLEKIIAKVNEEKPDITVITGDLIDGKHKYEEGYFNSLSKIKSKVYMITGNHERMTGMDMVDELLKKSKIIMLQNKKINLDNNMNLIGIDDDENSKKMIKELKDMKINNDDYNILLYHRPTKFKQATKQGIDLMLTGHTHAGQIFPLNIILKFFYKKVQGLKKRKDKYLYVSPGTGWWGPPMRLGSHNEITIFELSPKK